jgi:hypothetical protein
MAGLQWLHGLQPGRAAAVFPQTRSQAGRSSFCDTIVSQAALIPATNNPRLLWITLGENPVQLALARRNPCPAWACPFFGHGIQPIDFI